MDSFTYNSSPSRVVFGHGKIASLPDELKRIDKSKPYFLSTPRGAADIRGLEVMVKEASLSAAGSFAGATMHTPTHITDKAIAHLTSTSADCIVSFGGGSTVGLGKALSVRTGLPHICIPTTYSGSEMTSRLGETKDGVKTTRSEPQILPQIVIYDVETTKTLPVATSATSGVNAIAHAGE